MARERNQQTETVVSRRRVLAELGAAVVGTGGIIAVSTGEASAAVTMGSLDIAGDSASVNAPPTRIDIIVNGEFDIQAAQTPDHVEVVCQAHVNGDVDDLDSVSKYGTKTGSFGFETDLYGHQDIERGALTPETAGQVTETELTVRIMCRAILDGEQVAEAFVEDTATIEMTKSGMVVSVGGSGSVEIATPS